jgi:hypothetical protein
VRGAALLLLLLLLLLLRRRRRRHRLPAPPSNMPQRLRRCSGRLPGCPAAAAGGAGWGSASAKTPPGPSLPWPRATCSPTSTCTGALVARALLAA